MKTKNEIIVRNNFGDAEATRLLMHEMKAALDGGGRVTILVRHAERPPLAAGDRTFGASLPLTEKGWSDAQRFGTTLARERFSSKREEMFDIMRSESTYTFDFDGITVETIVDSGNEKS